MEVKNMFLIPLLFIVLIIWVFVYLFRFTPVNNSTYSVHNNVTPSTSNNRPMEILKERFAKGEISEEEYLKIKKNLEQ